MLTSESAATPAHAPKGSVRNGFWGLVALTTVGALLAYPLFGALLNRVTRDTQTRLPITAYTKLPGAKEFTAADAHFRAVFPAEPKREIEQFRYPGGAFDVTMYSHDGDALKMAVGEFEFPASTGFDLYSGMNGAVDSVKGHLESSALLSFAGSPSIEFHFRGDGYFGHGVIVHAPSRAYLLIALTPYSDPTNYDAFKSTFVIT